MFPQQLLFFCSLDVASSSVVLGSVSAPCFSSVPRPVSLPKEKKEKKKKVEVEKEEEDSLKKKAGTAFRSVGDGCDEPIGTRGNVECRCDENLCWRRSYEKVCAAAVDESNAPLCFSLNITATSDLSSAAKIRSKKRKNLKNLILLAAP